ncbi:MAG: hypothetical protein FIA91_04160 [Geobacter sp.]|nr:hypothetical protein [Geobacter sp.]
MKKHVILIAALFALAAPLSVFAADHDHSGHGMNFLGNKPSGMAHQEVVDGIKTTFTVKTMKDAMKEMGMEMPAGVKETHHISVSFNNAKTGKAVTDGDVKIKVQGPDKAEQTKDLPAMHGHFGADFDLAKKGKYGVMCKFKLPDGKVRSAKFWYEVK